MENEGYELSDTGSTFHVCNYLGFNEPGPAFGRHVWNTVTRPPDWCCRANTPTKKKKKVIYKLHPSIGTHQITISLKAI